MYNFFIAILLSVIPISTGIVSSDVSSTRIGKIANHRNPSHTTEKIYQKDGHLVVNVLHPHLKKAAFNKGSSAISCEKVKSDFLLYASSLFGEKACLL